MKRVLVVDDEESIIKVVDYALSEAGYEVHTARDVARNLQGIEITDLRQRTEMDFFAIPFPLAMIHPPPLLCSKLMRFLPDAFLSKASLASES